VTHSRVARGSIGGASGDGGVEYRRGVAAYAVASGLTGFPLLGLDIPAASAEVSAVTLETEDAFDDIRIDFDSGWKAFVQAKRSLRRGSVLNKAVAQWAEAVRPLPVANTRTCAESFGGTSTTVSPSCTSRCAMCLPMPLQPSIAQTRSRYFRPAASMSA